MRLLIDIVGVVVIERAHVIGARAVGSQQCVLALLNEFITPVSSLWKRNLERGGCSSPLSPPLEPPLIRISRICDNYVSFVKRHQLLTERLIKQGFWYNKLSVSFKKFSRRHPMLFNKYAVSVKRHIREGICIPLDVKPDLVRNITTRNRGCSQCA